MKIDVKHGPQGWWEWTSLGVEADGVTTVYMLTSETSHARRSTISEWSPTLLIMCARLCCTDVTHVIAATTTQHVTCLPKCSSSLGLDFARHTTPPS